MMKRSEYKTARHPETGKLWIVGHCGNGHYIPIREVEGNAKTEIIHLMRAEVAAKNELKQWTGK